MKTKFYFALLNFCPGRFWNWWVRRVSEICRIINKHLKVWCERAESSKSTFGPLLTNLRCRWYESPTIKAWLFFSTLRIRDQDHLISGQITDTVVDVTLRPNPLISNPLIYPLGVVVCCLPGRVDFRKKNTRLVSNFS